MMKKKYLLDCLLILFLIADIDYSFRQHEHKTLDGDVALITAPSKNYTTVLQEPFGLKASLKHEKYCATNRFFVHKAMYVYYRQFFSVFSSVFKNKINALYKITGLFQIAVQLLLIVLIIFYASKGLNADSTKILFVTVLITSLFQTHGYNRSIGVIDHSVTYTFFYAMPLMGLMIYFIPFLRYNIELLNGLLKIIIGLIWMILGYIISTTGALIPPIGTMAGGSILLYYLIKAYRIQDRQYPIFRRFPPFPFFVLPFFLICCIYSYYLGTYNAENGESIALTLRYQKLFFGLKHYFIQDISFLLLIILLVVNYIIVRKVTPKVPASIWIIGILCIIYVLLLPLGGYRSYRPYIIRNDTFLPVTLFLFYLIARSTLFILHNNLFNRLYLLFVCCQIAIFTLADKPHFDENRCQIEQMHKLQSANNAITLLPSICPILTWDCTKDTQWTIDGSRMLYFWGITDTVKMYRHE